MTYVHKWEMRQVSSTWQQDGMKAHTARETVHWLRQNVPDLIEPDQWRAKSLDLNVFHYCAWSFLLHRVQLQKNEIPRYSKT